MIDVSKYEKIGEYRNGEMVWISPKIENIVYLIIIGDESYIGSSINIRNRFQSFISVLKRGKLKSNKVQYAFDRHYAFDLYAIEFADRDNLRKKEEFYINTKHPSLNTKTHADYLYRDSLPLPPRHREKNIHRDIRQTSILLQKTNVKLLSPKKNKSGMKGVFAKIPLSMYRRLSNLKIESGDSIEDMVAQAISFLLIPNQHQNRIIGLNLSVFCLRVEARTRFAGDIAVADDAGGGVELAQIHQQRE